MRDNATIIVLDLSRSMKADDVSPSRLEYAKDIAKPDLAGFRVAWKSEMYIPLAGLLDVEAESKKINDQIEKLEAWLASCKRKLADEIFISKAPAQVIEREKNNEAEYIDKIEKLKKNLELLKK